MTAVIIDTVSIQQYVFNGNKLKENIGASYIIEELLYKEVMDEALKQVAGNSIFHAWENCETPPSHEYNFNARKVYVGGGNAMLLFQDTETAKNFIKAYSKTILEKFPGLRMAFGVKNDFNEKEFKAEKGKLAQALIQNKALYNLNVSPIKHGIVDDCPLANEAKEVFNDSTQQWISIASKVKIEKAEISQENLAINFKSELKGGYIFTDEIDRLGQTQEKGYVAIVHVDGNGIGKKFMECEWLKDLRCLSKQVNGIANRVMKMLIDYTISLFEGEDALGKDEGFELNTYGDNKSDWKKEWQGRKILPIRPLITAGDDFTFICHGKLGVHLAEKLIAFLNAEKITLPNGTEEGLSACGGVAIVKTHYPFYKAYQLAEELTRQAKEVSRDTEKSSWLSYLISAGGFAGSLNDIEHQQYTTPDKKRLRMKAYRVDKQASTIKILKDRIKEITNKWPNNKIMELRSMLKESKAQQDLFITETRARGLYLPKYENTDVDTTLWQRIDNEKNDGKEVKITPYYDIIELKDFYPFKLLNK
ncbi:MAG: hypothetical protein LC128_10270 [Chitinophagales bacterium]|nr:hypothetical protein [Chitinophagales bacterium]